MIKNSQAKDFNHYLSNTIFTLSLLGGLFLSACTEGDDLAGGSTDVETGGISGVAKISGDSLITEGTLIILNQIQMNEGGEAELLADSISSTIVDDEGLFNFDSLTPGTYSIESYQESTGKRNLNLEVEVLGDTTVSVESIMHTPGSITFRNIPEEYQTSDYSVYIPHLRLQKSLAENTSSLTLDSIPAGVNVEIRYHKSLIDQGLVAKITLPEGQDLDLNW